jgi:hypothetical protein
MSANWLRRTDTLDTLRVNNTILTGTANNNGLTLYQANLQYPALTTSTSVSSNQLLTTTTIGNLNATPQYSSVSSELNIQAKNPTQPVSSVILTINDISQASIATYIIGNNPTGFGGFAAAANRAYRYGYFKTGQVEKLENFAFVRSTNAGQAGMAEITGDVNFYFNMQVARNIYTAGSLNVVVGGATVSSLVPTVGGKSFINGIGGGLLGIGTTNPQYTLDVVGGARISGGITAQELTIKQINVYPPGLTVLDVANAYPYVNYSTGIAGPTIVYESNVGTSAFNASYTKSTSAINVLAGNSQEPIARFSLSATDISGTNTVVSYCIGNGYQDFGASNRAYRYILPKQGSNIRVESIAMNNVQAGAAGISEITGDISFWTNMQVFGNINTPGSIVAALSTTPVGLYGSGTTTIGGGGSINVPFTECTGSTRVMVTPTGVAASAVSVVAGVGSFTIYGTTGTDVNWMVIYL